MSDRDQPIFVLVRPQMGENIGACARAMLNFGLTRLRMTDPRDGWPNPRAVAMASGAASQVLDVAGVFPALPEALGDCTTIFATTARNRDLTKAVFTPEAAMREARRRIRSGERVAFLFGPERTGLENDDIAQATALVTIPVNPEFYSLNLGQAALLLSYEWMRSADATPPERMHIARGDMAERAAVQRLTDHFEQALEGAGFFHPPEKAPGMKLSLRNFWSRMPLTQQDVQTLHGAIKQLLRR